MAPLDITARCKTVIPSHDGIHAELPETIRLASHAPQQRPF